MRLPNSLAACLHVAIASLVLVPCAAAQTVWSDLTFTFNHPANSSNQDDITPNASLTRAGTRGLFNAAVEPSYLTGVSPEFTLWATSINNPGANVKATNWSNLIFDDWQTAYGGPGSLAINIVGASTVLYLTLDDVYLDLKFTSWAVGTPGGGAFSYQRAQPPLALPTGDYNGNLVVDAADYTKWRDTLGQMVENPGDGADGNRSGEIDAADYDYWKERFGDNVPAGSAAANVVPEPTTIAPLIGGLLLLAARFRTRFTPRGPGQLF